MDNNFISTLVEVKLKPRDDEKGQNDFLKVKETLTRIGIASKKDKTLYQSCHILHKQGRFFIIHFKELFLLDGKKSDFTEEDKARRNTIANLLDDWGLLELEDYAKTEEPVIPISQIKIIPFSEKKDWNLIAKYTIGIQKHKNI